MGLLAWTFAVLVLHSTTPVSAPMAALLVIDRTMVRPIPASAQRLLAVMAGTGVSLGGSPPPAAPDRAFGSEAAVHLVRGRLR